MKKSIYIIFALLLLANIGLAGYYFLYVPSASTPSVSEDKIIETDLTTESDKIIQKKGPSLLTKTSPDVINVLELGEFRSYAEPDANMTFKNDSFTLDNTFGDAKDGGYTYTMRATPWDAGNGLEATIQMYKEKGDYVAVIFGTEFSKDESNFWTIYRRIEVALMDDNNLYVSFYNEKNKDLNQIFLVGKMPADNIINIKIVDHDITVSNSNQDLLGEFFLEEEPFAKTVQVGVAAGPNSILKVTQFLARFSLPS